MEPAQTATCSLHQNKICTFYCFNHLQFCCSKCLASHTDCQKDGKFEALDDIIEKIPARFDEIGANLNKAHQILQGSLESLSQKIETIEKLSSQDLNLVTDFFDKNIKKLEELKTQVCNQYKNSSTQISELIKAHKIDYTQSISNVSKAISDFKTISSIFSTEKSLNIESKIKHLLDANRLEACSENIDIQFKGKETLRFLVESCLSKETLISELGHLTNDYMSIESNMNSFIQKNALELLPSITNSLNTVGGSKEEDSLFQRLAQEEQEKKEKETIYAKFISKLTENSTLNVHQVRYCSNEVIVYNKNLNKFESYELYTDSALSKEFKIFNNCCSISIGSLVFLFGGEDPNDLDITSSKAFVCDISENIGVKILVKELPRMLYARQEFTLACKNSFIYIISGYDGTQSKDKKIISKCEKFDLKKFQFYEIREINYPRQWACCTFMDENSLYVFNGFNMNYIQNYVDKVEKFRVPFNDWMPLKYTIHDNLYFLPGIKGFCFPLSGEEIFVFGGVQDGYFKQNSNFIFDTKKCILRLFHKKLLKEEDEFFNQNNISSENKQALLCSAQYARRLYTIKYVSGQEQGSYELVMNSKTYDDDEQSNNQSKS